MSYSVHQIDSRIRIRAANIPAAVRGLRRLYQRRETEWPCPEDATDLAIIETVFGEWSWNFEIEEASGDVTRLQFTGEKYHDDDQFFAALAPAVERGSFIEMAGDDDYQWRWVFTGRRVIEHRGRTVFPPLPGTKRKPIAKTKRKEPAHASRRN